jgi:hypothetical protein
MPPLGFVNPERTFPINVFFTLPPLACNVFPKLQDTLPSLSHPIRKSSLEVQNQLWVPLASAVGNVVSKPRAGLQAVAELVRGAMAIAPACAARPS